MTDSPLPHRWPIEPGRGIGPLRIGMPIGTACRLLDDAGLGPMEPAQKGSGQIYVTRGGAVHLLPTATPGAMPAPAGGDACYPSPSVFAEVMVAEIEVLLRPVPPLRQPVPELFGRALLGEPLGAVRNFLFSVDARAERRAHLVEAPSFGVRVWSGGDPPQWPVNSVTVTRPVPPARVLAPSFTFERLGRVLQSLGFTGGATTVRAPLLPGEPEVAEWSRRQVLLRYTFDPVTSLRVLYLDGPEADSTPVVQRVMARLPMVGEEQVLAGLESDDDETCLRAIQSASALRMVRARARLRALSQDRHEPVHSAAISALIGLPDAVDGT